MIASILLIWSSTLIYLLGSRGGSGRFESPRAVRRAEPHRRRPGRRTLCRGRGLVVLVTGHRHELLRVAPHAVLGHVEPIALLIGLDPQPDRGLDREEGREADREHRRERGADGSGLGEELVHAPRV